VRNATQISANPISIASVAVTQAAKILRDNLGGMTGVVVGAGDMGKLAAKHLLRAGCDVILLGRNAKKIEQIAQELGENVKADDIANLPKYLNRYRLVFTATSSAEPIITKKMVEERDLKRIWFDMAIPRDIEEFEMDQLQIFRIDDLKHISADNHALRQEQAIEANDIVDRYENEFFEWLRALSVEPVIKGVRMQAEHAIEEELSRAIKKGFVPVHAKDNMRKMAEQMFNRFLHAPTVRMRESSKEKNGVVGIDALKNIFDIDMANVNFKQYKKEHHKKGYSS